MEKKVVELFAGVGGFRVGLNEVTLSKDAKTIEKNNFDFVWANQWEPSTKIQHAFDCYETRFGKSEKHVNKDISQIDKKNIPDHTLLVGGFPCQDYSVARSLSKEKGIEGKKGVLWWEIHDVLIKKRPPFVLLENVDRLLKSPSKQRGRDFGIMLRSLNDLGYGVEWRVVNAAEYGHPQRRRRVFIFAFNEKTEYYKKIVEKNVVSVLQSEGFFSQVFPVLPFTKTSNISINKENYSDIVEVSNRFDFKFEKTGLSMHNNVYTVKTESNYDGPLSTLKELVEHNDIPEEYFLNDEKLAKFKHLRGHKKIERTRPVTGEKYYYSEGAMSFPDALNLPGRTMLTSEGSINRSTHIIYNPSDDRIRLITPVEAERLNQFPDNWTNTMPNRKRYFMMGNALVCGAVSQMGKKISEIIGYEK